MTILIDMDDVLEQLVVGWVQYLNDHYGTNATEADVKSWNMPEAFPTLTEDEVYSAVRDDGFWGRYVLPMPGAREALQKLREDGHEIYIVTASYYRSLRVKMEDVLFRYFPELDWDHVVIASRKQLVRGDVLIDDGPHNLVGGEYQKILFHASHNASFDEKAAGAVRVHNWEEAYREICRIDEQKKRD